MCVESFPYVHRLDELQVCDLQFLHGCATPTIIKLHQDSNGRHIRTHTLSLKEKEFTKVRYAPTSSC